MYCESCGEVEATIHITQTVNGQTKRIHLCSKCAAEGGHLPWTVSSTLPVGSLLGGLAQVDKSAQVGSSEVVCPGCGLSYRDFSQGGFFGCAECYKTFEATLDPLLKRIQGDTVHRGKLPAEASHAIEGPGKEARLREELQRAIEAEEYERAAEIRDEIRELEDESE